MRHPHLAVNCSHSILPRPCFGLLACSREGLKCHNNVQVSVLFTGRQHLDISTWFLAAVKSCCNTANLERAHFYWHEQVWPLLTTQHTGTLLHIMSVGLVHESKQNKTKKPVWTLMLVAEERVASPRTAQRVSVWEKGLWRVFLLTQFKYAHMRGENHSHVTN